MARPETTRHRLTTGGHTPRDPDGTPTPGKLGADLTGQEGYAAARIAGLNLLSTVRNTLGSLDGVVPVVKVLGMVNCTPDFGQQPQVVNGFSELTKHLGERQIQEHQDRQRNHDIRAYPKDRLSQFGLAPVD